jgi:hypothetical protein
MTGKTQREKDLVFPTPDKTYYSSDAFDTVFPSTSSDVATIGANSVAKLYDAVAEVIAGNKYALLQEMVKLGVLRLVVERGVVRTALSFSTWEREAASSSHQEKHRSIVKDRYVQMMPASRGILGMLRARPMERHRTKNRDLHVQTSSESHSTSQGTNIVITGGVEIFFRTDYLPVAQA